MAKLELATERDKRIMALVWEKTGEAFYATVASPAGEPRFYLVVESLGAGWDWAVWRPGEGQSDARRGRAVTRHGAMWDAERAAT